MIIAIVTGTQSIDAASVDDTSEYRDALRTSGLLTGWVGCVFEARCASAEQCVQSMVDDLAALLGVASARYIRDGLTVACSYMRACWET